MLEEYLQGICKTAQKGDATEPSYYPNLKSLLEAFANESGHTKVQVTAQPNKTDAGNPDFRLWDGKQHIIGYLEAKPASAINRIMLTNVCRLDTFRQKLDRACRSKRIAAIHRLFSNGAMPINILNRQSVSMEDLG